MATVTGSNTASAASVTINRRKTPDKDCSARCATTLDIRCNSEGEIPLALPLPEVKPRFPQPLKLMHFHSGPLMYFCSGVDRLPVACADLPFFQNNLTTETQVRSVVDTNRYQPRGRANRNYPGGSRGCNAASTAARARRDLRMRRRFTQYCTKETRYIPGRLDYYFLVVWSYRH